MSFNNNFNSNITRLTIFCVARSVAVYVLFVARVMCCLFGNNFLTDLTVPSHVFVSMG